MIVIRTIPACRWTSHAAVIRPFFVNELRVWRTTPGAGDGSGISISEDPKSGSPMSRRREALRVEAKDTRATSSRMKEGRRLRPVTLPHLSPASGRGDLVRTLTSASAWRVAARSARYWPVRTCETGRQISPTGPCSTRFRRCVPLIRQQWARTSIEQEHCSMVCRVRHWLSCSGTHTPSALGGYR